MTTTPTGSDATSAALSDDLLDPIEPAAYFMAAQPGGPERVLAQHTRREDGRCSACSVHALVSWPCGLASIAQRAQTITTERRKVRQSRQTLRTHGL